jgi:hypothetical protein
MFPRQTCSRRDDAGKAVEQILARYSVNCSVVMLLNAK